MTRPTTRMRGALLVAAALLGVAACRSADAPRFTTPHPGVVHDAVTGLDWTARDRDEALAWDAAERVCRDLALGGRDDWRLPEVDELAALYDPARDEPCGARRCRLDPAFRVGGPYVWTATERGVGARFYVDLAYGNQLSPTVTPELVRRVLCVRGTSRVAPTPRSE